MNQELKALLVSRLVSEDKSGIAYALDMMKGRDSLGYHFYCEYTKKELLEKVSLLTEDQLAKLDNFRTYQYLFRNPVFHLVPATSSDLRALKAAIRENNGHEFFYDKTGNRVIAAFPSHEWAEVENLLREEFEIKFTVIRLF